MNLKYNNIRQYNIYKMYSIYLVYYNIYSDITCLHFCSLRYICEIHFCIFSLGLSKLWTMEKKKSRTCFLLFPHFFFLAHEKKKNKKLFYGHTCSIWKFLGQQLNLSHSLTYTAAVATLDPLIHWAEPRIKPMPPQQPKPLQLDS